MIWAQPSTNRSGPPTPSKTRGPPVEELSLTSVPVCGPKTSGKNMIRRRMVAIDADRLLVYLRANDVTVHQITSTKDGSLTVFLEGYLGQYDRARIHVRNLLYYLDAITGYGIKKMTPGIMKIIRGYTEEEFDESPLDADGPRTFDG
jgi:hypothetical protein